MEALIEMVSVKSLTSDPANARKHDKKNIDAIKGSLTRFGQQKPIIVNDKGVVVAGNGTLAAAKALKWKDIAVVRTGLEGMEATAFALADNRSAELAAWDGDVLGKTLQSLRELDFPIEDIGFEWDNKDENPDITDADDEVPEIPQNVHGVELGDVWQLGEHRLMCGDSTLRENVERLMAGEKADMVFTDPPYGVSYADKNTYLNSISPGNRIQKEIANDHGSTEEMHELWCKIFNMTAEYSTNKASYYICSPQGGELMMMMQAISQSPWSLKHMLIWNKNNHVLGRCDYNYKHEPILYGWKKKGTHEFFGKGEKTTSVWDIPKPQKNDLHPTMKPIALMVEAILNSCKEAGLLFEPFCGSGSTLIACEKTGRKCNGLEIDPHYCSVIIERWQKTTGKTATLTAAGDQHGTR